jgi:exopolysaccharide production protein ExoZ
LSMEGLRGFAVALVFFVHYSTLIKRYAEPSGSELWWVTGIHEIGNSGVDLFFVLSGFLIYKASIHQPLKPAHYAYRRIERIYPTFIVVLTLYILLSLAVPEQSKLPQGARLWPYLLENLFLLPGIFPIEPIITVAWSLSYEALYYILAPATVVLLSMRNWRSSQRLAFFVLLYAAFIALRSAHLLGEHFRMSMFFGGMMLYELGYHLLPPKAARRRNDMLDVMALGLLIFALGAFALLGDSDWMIAGTVVAEIPHHFKFVLLNGALVFVLYRCLFSAGLAAAAFSWSPLRWLGNASYSYYLVHGLGLQFFFTALSHVWVPEQGHPALYLALLLPAFLASALCTLPIYLLIERPFSLKPVHTQLSAAPDNTRAEKIP